MKLAVLVPMSCNSVVLNVLDSAVDTNTNVNLVAVVTAEDQEK